MERKIKTVRVGNQDLVFETGKVAKQANGAVIVRSGDTVIFTSACSLADPNAIKDFFPLRVDYQEKFFSAGKTVGGFFKREGRPTEKETLTARLIDRPLRPMFEEGYCDEVQILSYVWSYDGVSSTDPLTICCASAALTISDIPLIKPIGAVRVGMINDRFIINPTMEEMERSKLDLMLAGTEDAVLMIEGFCDFLTEKQVIEAIETGHRSIQTICHALKEWQQEVGKPKNRSTIKKLPQEVIDAVENIAKPMLEEALLISSKQDRETALSQMNETVVKTLLPEGEEPRFAANDIKQAIKQVSSKYMRKMILEQKRRPDGRSTTDIRPIDIEQSLLPRTHGSSLFTRGETQTVAVCTLGGESMAQRFESLDGEGQRRFYLQYFFPPFSVGEVGRFGAPGRREIGHGILAERALKAILPDQADFPYTIRVESNITESNGSSSMASVCGGCLAMMDAGVPVKTPVSGIAMGLILENEKFVILSDILGIEDALGDMDFKVAGNKEGITAFQMDIKVEGITIEIMTEALEQAKAGRIHILNKMTEACPKPKAELSVYAPRIETLFIKPSKIAIVIGPGGKQIRSIIETTGVEINIDDDGRVSISSSSKEGIEEAKRIIESLTAEVEIGRTYDGRITSVVPFGVFVEILPGKEGLCHISEFDHARIKSLDEIVKQGDMIKVKVLDINDRGQVKLSRKATLALPTSAG
jgi:polyribonucleotide nucleotidyltransferase